MFGKFVLFKDDRLHLVVDQGRRTIHAIHRSADDCWRRATLATGVAGFMRDDIERAGEHLGDPGGLPGLVKKKNFKALRLRL